MKLEMLDLLSCPNCRKPFRLASFKKEDSDTLEGILYCGCGRAYPIIDSIPRILPEAFVLYRDFTEKYRGQINSYVKSGYCPKDFNIQDLKKKTQASFGYQWTSFSQMSCDFRDNFLNYIWPVEPEFFKGKLGMDAGCGFGRHIYNAAKFGAKMVGVDFSRAIESTYRNTKAVANISLAQADIYNLPFTGESFDFVYSLGVLHHLPGPEAGFRSLVRMVKPGGSIFIWVYSKRRKWAIRILEPIRKVTTRLPFPLLKIFCFFAAVIDYYLFIWPLRLLKQNKFLSRHLARFIFPRACLYGHYPFQVNFADWFDRLSAPIRFYYDGKDMHNWFERAGLANIKVSATGLYGWRAYGEKGLNEGIISSAVPC